ncbi:MAG: hypothetical protein ILP02_02475 [Clostridia bacterium]|nr:hypothetical protein [Clostridia bacterium]
MRNIITLLAVVAAVCCVTQCACRGEKPLPPPKKPCKCFYTRYDPRDRYKRY